VFEQVIDINLTGTMRCCSAARPLLAKTGGAIVNIASMLSFFGGGLVPGYSASKGGVAQLTKSLAIAYAADTIRVNAVARGHVSDRIARMRGARPSHASRTRIAPRLPGRHGPGWIATPLTESLQQDTARSQAILDRTPMKRWGRPEDVAGAVLFLCSPAAAFITGTILPVDGGYLTA
jgi:NAD(P)-dependent dehydrogenase (short-subunit alcohol dehydrogenase family)